ncbi:DUF2783 domain-containing protein [Rhizobium laguerreae]|uniref:Uncharacterized protein DUF2783 n=1 Tax=Rhizobium laguerreae TaxID=1076926 RepID=A0A1S9GAL0_9HYPH|nr:MULTISPECIES: DUF2783 domain-containing protein [Rhizobium]MBB3163259.1 hypothetical protein [Rhizobium laguerreae]MBY3082289.1 DUF2783 domain-containing protein [Rhizobium laguerreae]MBY3087955.1 DUF2783 domain-containing protein [Rhizobium laguerreae]MBY3116259.1 DUF2783 domain-containing protein [Rhizobium laguerreae]MBY3143702.1 DUF2783 domain-containing protein [Rhizobium laguerreae]
MLETNLNFNRPDESYALLIKAHEGLSEAESHAMNARLILILMNQIGDHAVIADALALARDLHAAT